MKKIRLATAFVALFTLQGCFGITVFDSPPARETAIDHTATGIAFKTFPNPLDRVRHATLRTLVRMHIKVTGDRRDKTSGWNIRARRGKNLVKIEFEPVSRTATRMRVIVSNGTPLFKDKKTGTEIISRTEAELRGRSALRRMPPQSARQRIPSRN